MNILHFFEVVQEQINHMESDSLIINHLEESSNITTIIRVLTSLVFKDFNLFGRVFSSLECMFKRREGLLADVMKISVGEGFNGRQIQATNLLLRVFLRLLLFRFFLSIFRSLSHLSVGLIALELAFSSSFILGGDYIQNLVDVANFLEVVSKQLEEMESRIFAKEFQQALNITTIKSKLVSEPIKSFHFSCISGSTLHQSFNLIVFVGVQIVEITFREWFDGRQV